MKKIYKEEPRFELYSYSDDIIMASNDMETNFELDWLEENGGN